MLTAAHCLPLDADGNLVMAAHPWSDWARTYQKLLGPLGVEPTVWAECLFVNPIADIAILGCPDNQELSDEADAYEAFVGRYKPLPIADAPKMGHELFEPPHPDNRFGRPSMMLVFSVEAPRRSSAGEPTPRATKHQALSAGSWPDARGRGIKRCTPAVQRSRASAAIGVHAHTCAFPRHGATQAHALERSAASRRPSSLAQSRARRRAPHGFGNFRGLVPGNSHRIPHRTTEDVAVQAGMRMPNFQAKTGSNGCSGIDWDGRD